MTHLLHQLISNSANEFPVAQALKLKGKAVNYKELASSITEFGCALQSNDVARHDRIAIYLPKTFETVYTIFGASMAGCVFVPVNPVLKPEQVAYILKDCNVRVLVTSSDRVKLLMDVLAHCTDLHTVICSDNKLPAEIEFDHISLHTWSEYNNQQNVMVCETQIVDTDMAGILYTSGSTGKPKGVVLSHRNMVCGANSVSEYLANHTDDKILAVLPFSFDAGFSQLTTGFRRGACVVMLDYLLPRDVLKTIEKEKITGITAVPPLWVQLAQLEFEPEAVKSIRYIANTGGAMPLATLQQLKHKLPSSDIFLMYGLTEAFRSTYLPPTELDKRPTSMGKAIPNAEIMVVREDGTECAPDEPGELVHRGSLVAMGYWNDSAKTAERFKPVPGRPDGIKIDELAVFSGDKVKKDKDGYLYFISRNDEMIKTSGYRVSPTEIEEIIYQTGKVSEVAAFSAPHPALGQAIVVAASTKDQDELDIDGIINECRQKLPGYMIPAKIVSYDILPKNPNGKLNRKALSEEHKSSFSE